MKQRIRTVKPEFFAHEVLFDAEQETGLPLRLAFIGLWSCCDREGRFEWRPRPLKSYIMPYDDVDFSRVLDALASRGFVVKYASGGREYGCVPSWKRHQVINNRETPSELPEIGEVVEVIDELTRSPRVTDASVTCTSGREGKGRELEGKKERAKALLSSDDDMQEAYDAYNEMAKRVGLPEAQSFTPKRMTGIKARLRDAGGIDGWIVALDKVEQSDFLTGKRPTKNGPFFADLDFILQQSSFTKIMEGSYDNRKQSGFSGNQAGGANPRASQQHGGLVGAATRFVSGQESYDEGWG